MTTQLPEWFGPLLDNVAPLRAADFPRAVRPTGEGRSGAVLILLGAGETGPDLVMIERAATLRDHAGQCAFPGGGAEPGDDGPAGTALREAAEEIGLRPDTAEVVAVFPELYLSISRFNVTPVLAWWREPHPVTALDAGEVARVARLPIAALADPANRFRVRHRSGYVGPAFLVDDMLVWGFTGGIVATLLDLAGWARPWDESRVEPLPPDI
ncbi:MAG TPA: CoA pyrophosphatase [Actinocatenispora sp.]